jgi:hypothetical protein
MAEQYTSGVNRVFYTAAAFKVGLVVTATILDQELNVYNGVLLTEVVAGAKGLYYFDYNFRVSKYVVVFSEEGKQKLIQVYDILSPPVEGQRTVINRIDGSQLINM